MKLTDLDRTNTPIKALKENFEMNFDVNGLNNSRARQMLAKVRGLIAESKKTPGFHRAETNPSYLKLVFMEQALKEHVGKFRNSRIIFENEEVEKSQVILAAQDMIDTIQKMYEDVNDMLVKELPALVDSIQSEIGANESESFNQSVSDALSSLNSSLQETQSTLKSALGAMTGQEMADAFSQDNAELDMDADVDMDMDADLDMDMENDIDAEAELNRDMENEMPVEPEDSEINPVGRAKR